MKKKSRPIGAVATVTLLGVFTRAISFLFKIYLSRKLGAEALGLYQIALSVFLLFASLSSSGVPLIVSRKVAESDALGQKNNFSIFTTALIYAASLALFILLILISFHQKIDFLFSDPLACPLFLIMIPALLSTAVYCVVRGWFWGKKMFAAFSVTETLEETLRILFSILFLSGVLGAVSGATAIAFAFTVSDVIVAVILLAIFFIKGGTFSKPVPLKEILLPSLPITAMRVCASIFSTLLALLLPMRLVAVGMSHRQATESFGRITGMANPLLFVPTTITGSIAVVLLPDISALAVKKEYVKLNSRIEFGINFSMLLSGLFTALYFVLGEKLTLFLYGDAASGQYLSIAAFSMLPMCLSQMTQSILNSIGKEKQSFLSYLAGNVVMILLVYLLPPYVGVYSVAIATTASFWVDGIINSVLLHNTTGWGKKSVKYLLFSLFLSFLTAFFTGSFGYLFEDNLFITLAFSAAIGAFVYVGMSFICGLVDVDLLLAFCRKKKHGKEKV